MDNRFDTDALGVAVSETFDNGLKVIDSALETHVRMDGGVGKKITDSFGDVADVQFMSGKNIPMCLIPFSLSLTAKKLLSEKVAYPPSLPDLTNKMGLGRGAS